MSEIIIASKGPDIVISRPASYIVFGSGGLQGPPGAVGPRGEPGEPGQGLTILGTLDSSGDLPVSGSLGDGYIISGELWVWTFDSWTNVGQIVGPAGDDGADGTDGTDGTLVLGGTVDPTTEGVDGDWYIQRTSWHIWEKVSGTWTDRGSIKGADGTDGKTIISGSGDPTTEGVDGDFYINTTSWQIFGPKATTWPAGVDIVGADGTDGTNGQGVPTGGTTGQVLAKSSSTDYATEWVDASSGGGGVSLGLVIALS